MSGNPKKLVPGGAPTLVGSLPHLDRQRALDLIFEEIGEIPVWPQLSSYPSEQMMVQYNEGLPGLVSESDRTRFVTSNPSFEKELVDFYEEYLAVTNGELSLDQSRFGLGVDSGKTLFSFMKRLEVLQPPAVAVKGQTTGPFTLLAGLKDENDQLALYEPRLRDLVVKSLALKAEWQAEQLSRHSLPVILCIDEPALAGFGSSAFISVSAEEVTDMIDEVARHIRKAGGLAGVHVCANTDWSLFFGGSLDLINFDAYTYFERFALYREDLLPFLDRGGIVAWGLIPTMEEDSILQENAESLARRWRQQVEQLVGANLSLETIFRQSIITPSCGCGTLPEHLAERVVQLTRQVSDHLRREIRI